MRHLKLGKKKKKVAWRRAKGRDSKIRLKRFGYPAFPSVGYKTPKSESGKIEGLTPILIHNLKELASLDKNSAVTIAKVGAKKRLELLKKADEMKIKILNSKSGGRTNEAG